MAGPSAWNCLSAGYSVRRIFTRVPPTIAPLVEALVEAIAPKVRFKLYTGNRPKLAPRYLTYSIRRRPACPMEDVAHYTVNDPRV